MFMCKVQGKCVSTIKHKDLQGLSLVTVQKINNSGEISGEMMVVVDSIGCSQGETVLVVTGGSARMALNNTNSPIDAVIIGIVDHYEFK